MSGRGKSYVALKSKIEEGKRYPVKDAMDMVVGTARVKFDETVDGGHPPWCQSEACGPDGPGECGLPNGLGKSVRVLVFAKGEKEKEALDAGADFVGSDEFVDKIKAGWLDFDRVIATPDMMGSVGKLGKILGPRGLMPNPKVGTVTFEIGKAVKELKAGRVEFRVERSRNRSQSYRESFFRTRQAVRKSRCADRDHY